MAQVEANLRGDARLLVFRSANMTRAGAVAGSRENMAGQLLRVASSSW